jgi:hypothetical protein
MIMRSLPIVLRATLLATISWSCGTGQADKSVAGTAKRALASVGAESSRARLDTYHELVAGRLPALPSAEKGICPFECCQFGNWTADDSIDVFAVERDSSTRPSRLPPGTAIVADSGDLFTVAWGIAIMQERANVHRWVESALDTLPFPPDSTFLLDRGDTVFHAGHIPEAGLIVMIRGRAYLGSESWYPADILRDYPDLSHRPALLVQPLREEWWVHVRVGNRSGWIDAYHSKVSGSDACA